MWFVRLQGKQPLIASKQFMYVESYLMFLSFLIKLSFSDTTVIEGGRERKHSWELSFYFGRYLCDIVSLITQDYFTEVDNTPAYNR